MTYPQTSLLSEDPLQRYIRYKNNPWDFLTECVYTKDEVDAENPIKLFPDKEYLKYFVNLWVKYKLLLVPKTRRMTMSWTCLGLYTWEALFWDNKNTALVSKKEDDANELCLKVKFIYDNLDNDKIPKDLLPTLRVKFNYIEFVERGSLIRGFPMGADQLRQFTFSGIFGDESAFWEKAKEFYSATLPTIDGGGRMTLVSSPAPGFFKFLCFDMLDFEGVDFTVPEKINNCISPMQGIRIWKNLKNKFIIFELHYMADPTKRHPDYAASIRASMPLMEYLREYELHWDTFAGFPVYPEFSKLHKVDKTYTPIPGLPILIGFDFGLTPAAVLAQYSEETLTVFKEYIELNMGAERFLAKVAKELKIAYPTFANLKKDYLCFIDPSGFFRKDTDEGTCADIVRKYFEPQPGPVAWEERRHAVVELLQRMTPEGPAFQVVNGECPMLTKGFEGGYHFSEKSAEIEPTRVRPLKNAYSHPHDGLQYICAGVKTILNVQKRTVPKPTYAITKGLENGRNFHDQRGNPQYNSKLQTRSRRS